MATNPFRRLKTFGAAMQSSQKEPAIGVTQGGSSNKYAGAKSAAKDADVQHVPQNAE